MKVEVEKQPQSMATLRIEVPSEQVSKEREAIAESYARQARIPGYRPGKAPRRVIESKFRKEIQDELTQRLVSKSYQEAVAEKQLRVVSLTNVEDVEFGQDQSMKFRATIVTAPEFDLPDYKNISVQLPDATVNAAEVDAALERLLEQSADFIDAPERGVQMGDFLVIDFEGTVDGKSIAEVAPESSKNLQGGKKFWLQMAPGNFLPKFCEQLVDRKRGETLMVNVTFPADFPVAELTGKKADYAVTLNAIKERVLPPLDDAFAEKLIPGKKLADLRHTVEHNLEHEKEHEIERTKEAQILRYLHEHIQFDLPPSLLTHETRRALGELVQRNRQRGVPDEVLKSKEKELVEGAGGLAANRLKTNFILSRIAEEEKLKVTRAEIDARVREYAAHHQVPVEKMRKQLEENESINGLVEEILLGKTIDFLKHNVIVEKAPERPAEANVPDEK